MNLEFSDDQKFVQKTARDYLGENAPLSLCRAVLEGNKPYDPALWKGVAEMGWLGTAVPEVYGGAGLSHLELVLIAQELGRALAPIPFSSSVYLATEALLRFGSEEQKKRYLPRLASGDLIGTFAVAEGSGDLEPGTPETRFDGAALHGTKLPVPDGDVAGLAVVLASEGNGQSLALVELGAKGVTQAPLRSFDPSRSMARLEFAGAAAERLGAAGKGAEQSSALLDRAAAIMAFEQIGGAGRALELTREFTMNRWAFGRPVASFQVLKHRMADLYAAIELARSNAYYGAWALSHDAPELATAAPAARVAATDAFHLAGEEMVQMYGGVGFTWEYDCHLFYRRARWTGAVLGTASEWREKLIARLEKQHTA